MLGRNNNTMRILSIILLLCVGALQGADAQTFTQRLQKHDAGKGKVTLHQSDSIDQLVNSAVLGSTAAPARHTPTTAPTTKPTSTTADNKPHTTGGNSTTAAASTATQEEPTQKVIRGGYKTMGFRVQAFAGGNSRADRQRAERTRDDIKQQFPNVPVYVHFHSPRWICRVGNFKTYEEAHQMLVSLRNLGFNQSTIVKEKITVAY